MRIHFVYTRCCETPLFYIESAAAIVKPPLNVPRIASCKKKRERGKPEKELQWRKLSLPFRKNARQNSPRMTTTLLHRTYVMLIPRPKLPHLQCREGRPRPNVMQMQFCLARRTLECKVYNHFAWNATNASIFHITYIPRACTISPPSICTREQIYRCGDSTRNHIPARISLCACRRRCIKKPT